MLGLVKGLAQSRGWFVFSMAYFNTIQLSFIFERLATRMLTTRITPTAQQRTTFGNGVEPLYEHLRPLIHKRALLN